MIFWIGLGLVAASFQQFGMIALTSAIVALIAVNALREGGRKTLALCRDSLAEGAKTALPVGIACAIVGIVIGTMTLTGAANTFGQFIVSVGEKSLFLSLVLTMITCLILGMGIPTIPNYIITSSIAGPALLALGVPLLVSHMFVFYFGILADLTPPVALACFAAAPIAKETRPGDLDPGHQGRGGRLRDPLHGGLLAGADAAAGRPDGRRVGPAGGGGLHHLQGRAGHRAVGRGRHRLPAGAR